MVPLLPCNSCRRHVRESSSTCPFCKAPRVAAVLLIAVSLAGCSKGVSEPSAEAKAEEARRQEEAQRKLEEARLAAEKERLLRVPTIYGGPPVPSASAGPVASARANASGQPARVVPKCNPNDPLCSDF